MDTRELGLRRPGRAVRALAAALFAASSLVAVTGPAGPVAAEADANLVPLVPARLLETRSGSGLTTVDGQFQGVGKIRAGTSIAIDVAGRGGVAADADSAVLNVTAVFPESLGFLTVYPCTSTPPQTSNVNYFAGDVAPNSVIAKISDAGQVCIYSLATTDVIVDVNAYVPLGGSPVSVVPARLVETRDSPSEVTVDGLFEGIGRVGAGKTVMFQATGRGGVPSNAEAVYLNVTAVFPDGLGFLTVYPCGTPRPDTSNVNYGPGDVSPNAVLATVGAGGQVCIYSLAATDVIADVNAYLPPGGNRVSIEPARCADTRPEGETFDGLFEGDGKIDADGTYAVTIAGRCRVAADASAAYLNVTSVNSEAPGFLTVYPCGAPRPVTSNVNYGPGQVQPNAVVSKIDIGEGGTICIYSLARTDVIVDVTGYVPAAGVYGLVDIATGEYHACGRHDDGTMTCWGRNFYGELGRGTTSNDEPPGVVPGIDDVVDIATNQGYTCALTDDGAVRCWGRNSAGQLGDGTTADRSTPKAVTGLTGVTQIATGREHVCALLASGAVRCWGDNSRGQLGDGSTADSLTPVTVTGWPTAAEPIALSAGRNSTCAVLDDGTAACWGGGGDGILGNGDGLDRSTPTLVSGLTTVTGISIGVQNTCAVLSDATVRCWGISSMLGNGDDTGVTPTPVAVAGLTGVTSVDVGSKVICVSLADGGARCWGENSAGESGNGTISTNQLTPGPVVGLDEDVEVIDTGNGLSGRFACVVLADSSASCWGDNRFSQLGVSRTTIRNSPVPIAVGADVS